MKPLNIIIVGSVIVLSVFIKGCFSAPSPKSECEIFFDDICKKSDAFFCNKYPSYPRKYCTNCCVDKVTYIKYTLKEFKELKNKCCKKDLSNKIASICNGTVKQGDGNEVEVYLGKRGYDLYEIDCHFASATSTTNLETTSISIPTLYSSEELNSTPIDFKTNSLYISTTTTTDFEVTSLSISTALTDIISISSYTINVSESVTSIEPTPSPTTDCDIFFEDMCDKSDAYFCNRYPSYPSEYCTSCCVDKVTYIKYTLDEFNELKNKCCNRNLKNEITSICNGNVKKGNGNEVIVELGLKGYADYEIDCYFTSPTSTIADYEIDYYFTSPTSTIDFKIFSTETP